MRGSTRKVRLKAGPRVCLRSPSARDRDEFLELVRRSRAFHHPWATPQRTREEFNAYLKRNRGEDFEALLVCERMSDAIIGVANLSQIFRRGFQNAYLGYWVGEGFAGQGYMTEALELVVAYAFTDLRLHRIEANIQHGNRASIRLVRRVGFRKEGFSPRYLKIGGRWRDHERWAITREDWKGTGSS